MAWRLAKSLEHMRVQVNAKWPNRSKESDGSIGDLRHQHESSSDHNPWVDDGVVTAIDITHDPVHGFDSYKFADMLLANQDPRLKYVISNRRIGSGPKGPSPGKWRKYTGSNAHDHHVHISVMSDKADYDSVKDWKTDNVEPVDLVMKYTAPPVTLKLGTKNADVRALQAKLGLKSDGVFGPLTEHAIVDLQNKRGLVPDGIVGPATWKVINE